MNDSDSTVKFYNISKKIQSGLTFLRKEIVSASDTQRLILISLHRISVNAYEVLATLIHLALPNFENPEKILWPLGVTQWIFDILASYRDDFIETYQKSENKILNSKVLSYINFILRIVKEMIANLV